IITQLLPQKKESTPKKSSNENKSTLKGANSQRQEEAITKARAKFLELGIPNISRAELARRAGVDRNTVGKHWEKITG
ncbi:hypothetical protein O4N84_23805, partial [Vibrio parahaemolyticus]